MRGDEQAPHGRLARAGRVASRIAVTFPGNKSDNILMVIATELRRQWRAHPIIVGGQME